MLKVIRGQEGTTAKGWSLNDVVANFATRGSENYFVQIAQLQSGHYIAGVAGGTANTLTLELPSTFLLMRVQIGRYEPRLSFSPFRTIPTRRHFN